MHLRANQKCFPAPSHQNKNFHKLCALFFLEIFFFSFRFFLSSSFCLSWRFGIWRTEIRWRRCEFLHISKKWEKRNSHKYTKILINSKRLRRQTHGAMRMIRFDSIRFDSIRIEPMKCMHRHAHWPWKKMVTDFQTRTESICICIGICVCGCGCECGVSVAL